MGRIELNYGTRFKNRDSMVHVYFTEWAINFEIPFTLCYSFYIHEHIDKNCA